MGENFQVFTLAELKTISVECSNCHAQMTFSAEGNRFEQRAQVCPDCREEIKGARALINQYRTLYQESLVDANKDVKITFRVKV